VSERRPLNRPQRAKALALPQGLSHVSTKGRVKRPAVPAAGSSATPRQSGIWYTASLDGTQVAAGLLATLCERFAVAVRDAGEPAGACLFAIAADEAPEAEGAADPHGATAIFFSPQAISVVPKILATLNAQPSAAPDRARASLLVGRPLDWDLLPRSTH
jgi:hypothetical protein